MSSPNLPDSKSASLILVHPTEEEKATVFRNNGAEWRGALSFEAYLRREAVLSDQALTRDGGITYWTLVDSASKENMLEPGSPNRLVLASCETYRKKALVWRNGKVEETISHGIGSVFCAPPLRKRGYPSRMMKELGNALRTWQTTDGEESLFSVLYSDIGKEFYAAHGWEPFNSAHISVRADASNESIGDLPHAELLHENDLEELCKIDETQLRKSLEARPANSNTAVALVPDIECIRWHHARENFVGKELHGHAPEIKGAIVGTQKGKRVWAYWTRMWYNSDPTVSKGNTLHILRLVVEGEDDPGLNASGSNQVNGSASSSEHKHDAEFAALLLVAKRQAQEWHLEEVEIWNPTSATISAAQRLDPKATLVNRDQESIASLRWSLPHDGPVAESIDWIGNEKYGWC